MKADDDVYVQIPRLLATLEHIKGKNNAIYGTVFKRGVPRSASDKHCVAREAYNKSQFPDFCVGEAYIMTRDAIPKLFTGLMERMNAGSEDAIVTGVVAEELGIQRIHLRGHIFHLHHSYRNFFNKHFGRWLMYFSTCIVTVNTPELFHSLWHMEKQKDLIVKLIVFVCIVLYALKHFDSCEASEAKK